MTGGNPLAAATALAVLETIETDGLLATAEAVGEHFAGRVLALGHPLVDHVRGSGLLRAIALTAPVSAIVADSARDAGFIVNPVAPDAIRIAPPLNLTIAEIDLFVDALPGLLDAAKESA